MFQKQTMLSVSYQLPTSYADSNSCTKKKERNRRTCQHSHVERSEYPNSVMRHRDGYRLLKHEKRIQSSMWKAHKMRKINQNLVSPIRVLQPYESCDLNSLAEEDSSQIVQTKRLKDRSFLLDRITFLSLNMHDDVSSGKKKDDFRSSPMQFISVYPYTCVRSTDSGLIVYPAEISITKFSLKGGITSVVSNVVIFDKAFYRTEGTDEIPEWDRQNVQNNASMLGVPLDSTIGEAPRNIWRWFNENLDHSAITVCDCSQYSLVHKSLCWLASLSLEDTGVSKGQILDWIYMVQDIAFALVKFKKDVGLSDLEIQTIFDKPRASLNDNCVYHAKKDQNDNSRHLCPVALSYRKIHALYEICRSCNLASFDDYYDESKHILCSEHVGLSVKKNIIGAYSHMGYHNSTKTSFNREILRPDHSEAKTDQGIFRTSTSSMASISAEPIHFSRPRAINSANFRRISVESSLQSTSKSSNESVIETVTTTIDDSIEPKLKLSWSICTDNSWDSPNLVKRCGKKSDLIRRFFKS